MGGVGWSEGCSARYCTGGWGGLRVAVRGVGRGGLRVCTVRALIFVGFNVRSFHRLAAIRESFIFDIFSGYVRYNGWQNDDFTNRKWL